MQPYCRQPNHPPQTPPSRSTDQALPSLTTHTIPQSRDHAQKNLCPSDDRERLAQVPVDADGDWAI